MIVGLGREVDHGRRDVLTEGHLGGAGVHQHVQDVGFVFAQQSDQTGQEGVAVPYLGCPAAVPEKGLVGALGHGGVVAFEHGDRVPPSAQLQSRGQARHPSTDHQNVHSPSVERAGHGCVLGRCSGCRFSTPTSRVLAVVRVECEPARTPAPRRFRKKTTLKESLTWQR